MKQNPPGWLIKPFYSGQRIEKYLNSKKNSNDAINHKKAYKFMYWFLHRFYQYVSVDCVTTVNYRYIEDFNWTKASDKLGVPFIMMYRECLLASDRIYDDVVFRSKKFGKFHGSHIIVHNKKCKQMFIDSGYAPIDMISIVSPMRMSSFFKLLKQNNSKVGQSVNNKKTFVLFYFPCNLGMFGKKINSSEVINKYKYSAKIWINREKLFIDLHHAIIELAEEYPDIEFIIKPKKVMVKNKSWKIYEEAVDKSKVNAITLSNYRVDENLDVNEGIINSSVICALQSSVVLESAIAGKRLIFPLFHNYLDSPHLDDFFWRDDMELFDVATSKNEFKKLFQDIISNPGVSVGIQDKRKQLFEKWFNSMESNSLDECYNIIENITQ